MNAQETQSHRVPHDDSITPLKNADEGSVKMKQARISSIRCAYEYFNFPLTFCQVRREFFVPNCNHFLSFKYTMNAAQAKRTTSRLLLNNFYPATSYRRVRKKRKATNCCTRCSLVMVREPVASARGLNTEKSSPTVTGDYDYIRQTIT